MITYAWRCPHCGCRHIRNRGSYAGNMRYHHDVQCVHCHRWYDETLCEQVERPEPHDGSAQPSYRRHLTR